MRLTFKEVYKSIERFNPVDLEPFSIITGRNGSGKTHLLESIRRGRCQIDSIETDDIVLFDLIAFAIKNELEYGSRQIAEEKRSAWSSFKGDDERPRYGAGALARFASACFTSEEKAAVLDAAAAKSRPILRLTAEDLGDAGLAAKMARYKRGLDDRFSAKGSKTDYYAKGIFQLAKKLDVFIDKIGRERFVRDYETTLLKEDFLPAQLGAVFMDYRLNEYIDTHHDCDGASMPPSKGDAPRGGGGPPPWDTINEFLTAYTGGKYSVTFPPPLTSSDAAYGSRKFRPKLRHAGKDIEINYNDLSSGEKVLLMLALCMFKARSKGAFPRLLLLDEVDATLHPSMIANLLRVITEVLNEKGTSVILATHSPTTVALAPDNCTYLVNPDGEGRIVKSKKSDAIAILTEGYMTLDEGLRLVDQLGSRQLVVFTEGDNVDYIEAAIRLFAPGHAGAIEVHDRMRDSSGAGQLRTLFTLFSRTDHETPVVVVWDPDYQDKGSPLVGRNNTHPYILAPHPESRASRGIESVFGPSCFLEDELTYVRRPAQAEEVYLANEQKKAFKDRIVKNADRETFGGFADLVAFIVDKLPHTAGGA